MSGRGRPRINGDTDCSTTACYADHSAQSTAETTALRQAKANISAASGRMSRTRQRDNLREVALRSALHRRGLRFRLHQRLIEGSTRTVDIVFVRAKLAIFLDGCFWHGCPIHGSWPKTNAEWWRAKIETNQGRDRDTDARLHALGWHVLRIWEHEDLNDAVVRVVATLDLLARGVGR